MNEVLQDIWKQCETCRFNDGRCQNKNQQEPCGYMNKASIKLFKEAKLKENWITPDKLIDICNQLKAQAFYTSDRAYKVEQKLEKIKEILETTCWDYTDITVTKVKDDILQIISEVEE